MSKLHLRKVRVLRYESPEQAQKLANEMDELEEPTTLCIFATFPLDTTLTQEGDTTQLEIVVRDAPKEELYQLLSELSSIHDYYENVNVVVRDDSQSSPLADLPEGVEAVAEE